MLEVASLLTVPEHVDRLRHASPDSSEVECAQPGRELLPDDDSGDEQITDASLEEAGVGECGDAKNAIFILELVDVEEVRE